MLYVVRKKHRIYSINDSFPLETSHLRQGNEHPRTIILLSSNDNQNYAKLYRWNE
jgi:hypothetical protein